MNASIPVPAVSLGGKPTVSSGSAMTIEGIILGWKITFLVCVSSLVITDPARDEVIASQPTEPTEVVAGLLAPLPGGVGVRYVKHMTHHLLPEDDRPRSTPSTTCC